MTSFQSMLVFIYGVNGGASTRLLLYARCFCFQGYADGEDDCKILLDDGAQKYSGKEEQQFRDGYPGRQGILDGFKYVCSVNILRRMPDTGLGVRRFFGLSPSD